MTGRLGSAGGLVAAVLALAAGPVRLSAQDSLRIALDSLTKQLERAEARIEGLEKQAANRASTAIETRSGVKMELSGRLIVNGFSNTRRVNNVDNPQFVRPDTTAGVPVGGLGMSPRQSLVRFAVIVPDVSGATFVGDLDADFYGGQFPSSGGRTFPLIRLRTMKMSLRWPRAELMAGQDVPVIAPFNPVSFSGIGTPDFATAGNLWLWLPQIRATIETSSRLRLGLQAAVLAPTSGDPVGTFDTDFDPAERSERPFLQARLRAKWGDPEVGGGGELGCGGHLGWLSAATDATVGGGALVESRAVACDVRLGMSSWLELRGEAYTGQALRGLGGGGIGQALGPNNVPVRDRGGWAQLNLKPSPIWGVGGGCGMDDPDDADLATAARLRNVACAGYVHLRPTGPLLLGGEYRRIATDYRTSGSVVNNHFNLFVGFEY